MKRLLLVFALAALAMPATAMELTSPDLANGAAIGKAQIYPRCGGENVAPALNWSGAPTSTKTFALTFIDKSVKPSGWSHWVVIDLPARTHSLPRGGALPAGAKGIASNFGDLVYAGPCPPAGTGVHRYEFTIYALPGSAPQVGTDEKADALAAKLSKAALATATLTGTAQH